jgi:hypothetical protein
MTSTRNQLPWPDRFSEQLRLFAVGEAFEVDAFLAESKLRPDYIWSRQGNNPSSGVAFLLGDGQTLSSVRQEEIAIDFLTEHRDELRALAQFPGVRTLNCGLVYFASANAVGFCVGPSLQLMARALDARVTPVYYINLPDHPIEGLTATS